ncbi:hypothetical protein [Streptomyces sp. NPDC048442]|uniref:hypothetical protein n=1 Tax=Streptomyces sp. NPDC048442 TaxID=3154823 RepID=UPI003423567C
MLPEIDDTATRIRINQSSPYGHAYYVDAATARAAIDMYPELQGQEVTWSTGPVPLHISAEGTSRFTAWSDGLLVRARPHHPMSAPDPLRWYADHRRYETARFPLELIATARNHTSDSPAVAPEVWLPWQHAVSESEETVDVRRDERAAAPDCTVRRTLTLTRYDITCADGTVRHLWQTADLVQAPNSRPPYGYEEVSAHHTVHATEKEARTALADLDDGLPPMMMLSEMHDLLGTTPDALRQAASRAARRERPRRAPFFPPSFTFGGRPGTWYDPRAVQRWWASRPGHGPGRGHTR